MHMDEDPGPMSQEVPMDLTENDPSTSSPQVASPPSAIRSVADWLREREEAQARLRNTNTYKILTFASVAMPAVAALTLAGPAAAAAAAAKTVGVTVLPGVLLSALPDDSKIAACARALTVGALSILPLANAPMVLVGRIVGGGVAAIAAERVTGNPELQAAIMFFGAEAVAQTHPLRRVDGRWRGVTSKAIRTVSRVAGSTALTANAQMRALFHWNASAPTAVTQSAVPAEVAAYAQLSRDVYHISPVPSDTIDQPVTWLTAWKTWLTRRSGSTPAIGPSLAGFPGTPPPGPPESTWRVETAVGVYEARAVHHPQPMAQLGLPLHDGFTAAAYENVTNPDAPIVLAFRGTQTMSNLVDDAFLAVGCEPPSLNRALQVTEAVRDAYPDTPLVLTGHSLGAALASYVALHRSLPAVVFENPGIVPVPEPALPMVATADARVTCVQGPPNILTVFGSALGRWHGHDVVRAPVSEQTQMAHSLLHETVAQDALAGSPLLSSVYALLSSQRLFHTIDHLATDLVAHAARGPAAIDSAASICDGCAPAPLVLTAPEPATRAGMMPRLGYVMSAGSAVFSGVLIRVATAVGAMWPPMAGAAPK